jgi:hypothetical protein
MKTYTSMARNVTKLESYERVELNVWDIATKTIIFTGASQEVANKLGTTPAVVRDALKKKYRLFKKYAIRTKSTKSE